MTCVTLKDFSDLLSIAFGINLALPVFRELVVMSRRHVVARLPALQSIVENRTYIEPAEKQRHLSVLSKIRVRMVGCDKDLSEKIDICSLITFMFALASLGWLIAGVYNPECLTGAMVFVSVWLNFLPLPISIAYLFWQSRTHFQEVNRELDALMQELM